VNSETAKVLNLIFSESLSFNASVKKTISQILKEYVAYDFRGRQR